MKNFLLGFFICLSLSLGTYLVWENYRHVPILIKTVPVPVSAPRSPRATLPPFADNGMAKVYTFKDC